jgi:hypothetical protein
MICDEAGEPVAEVTGFTSRLVSDLSRTVRKLAPHARHHVIRWREVPAPVTAPGPLAADRAVLLVYDGSTAADPDLAAELRAAGCRITEAVIGADAPAGLGGGKHEIPASPPGYEALFAMLNGGVLDDVVYLAPTSGEPAYLACGDEPALRLFEFVKAMIDAPVSVSRLCVVARNVSRITGAEK